MEKKPRNFFFRNGKRFGNIHPNFPVKLPKQYQNTSETAQQQQIRPRKLFSHGTLLLTTAYIHMKVVPAVHGKYLLNPTHIDTIFPKLWTRASPHCQHFRVNC